MTDEFDDFYGHLKPLVREADPRAEALQPHIWACGMRVEMLDVYKAREAFCEESEDPEWLDVLNATPEDVLNFVERQCLGAYDLPPHQALLLWTGSDDDGNKHGPFAVVVDRGRLHDGK